jgi:hypothetical protein
MHAGMALHVHIDRRDLLRLDRALERDRRAI